MESQKKRIRRDYAPLTVHAGLVCVTPSSPVTQVYRSREGEYEPDRPISPTVIHPDVVVHANDGSWKNPYVNSQLADMKWKVNGRDIATLGEWQGLYSINLEGSTRGDITIRKNLTPGTRVELSFEAVLADLRLGVNIPIKCDPIILGTTDSSGDDYSMSIGDDQIIQYDPFKDRLHLYDYKVSRGLQEASSAARREAMDENSYERRIPVTVFKGKNAMATSAYSVKLYEITGVQGGIIQLRELNTDDEIVDIANDAVTIDLRLVEKRDYLIRAFVGADMIAEKQFSVNRVYPKFTVRPTNGTSISPSDKERYDVAMVDCEGNKVECPESLIKIVWKTDSATLTGVEHGEGGEIVFLLSETGIGDDYTNDWLDVYCEGTQKEVHSIATDENNDDLTDENGDTLIFN